MSTWKTFAPYHILAYGTLFGTQIFQSFIAAPIFFKTLARPTFAAIQTAIFPTYFGMQVVLPSLLALTFPGARTTAGGRTGYGLAGFLAENNRWSALAPIFTVLLGGLANMFVIGPATTKTMKQRHRQETRDGKKSYDPGPHSEAMRDLNKRFGILHGISSMINVASVIATAFYAGTLATIL